MRRVLVILVQGQGAVGDHRIRLLLDRHGEVAPSERRPGTTRAVTASRVAPGVVLYGATSKSLPARYFYFSGAHGRDGVRASFGAFRVESSEGMRIERGAQVSGGARTFYWDLGSGFAEVEPPAPFSGHAYFREKRSPWEPEWKGSLQVPALGGRPIWLTGREFAAGLSGS